MSVHHTTVEWRRAPHPSDPRTYSRNHVATLNGEQRVNVSAAPEFKGDAACTDPEQLLLSALASCHMLTFLAIAELKGYRVERYEDRAVGHLEKGDEGVLAMTRIELFPTIAFGADNVPDAPTLERMHASAHRNCFIARSIKAQVSVSATIAAA